MSDDERCGVVRPQPDSARWMNAEQYDAVAHCCDKPKGHSDEHWCDEGKPGKNIWPNQEPPVPVADPVPAPTVDLDAIRARADAATPGLWFREYGDVVVTAHDPRDRFEDEPRAARVSCRARHRDMRDPEGIADAEFIAHARTDVPALLAEVSRQAAVIAQVRGLTLGPNGQDWEHNGHEPIEGKPECPGCWADDLLALLDGA